jgi:DNA-binding response OmpR family regulator
MQNILVVDDDDSLRDTIGLMLEQEGFHVTLVEDGMKGYSEALRIRPDLILADLRMPGMTGVEVCRRLRDAGVKTPIIILSAVGDEIDKVLLLEIGADDYVVKPFGVRELLARIRAVLRRTSPDSNTVITFSDNAVDLKRRVVTRRGEEIKLTRGEYNLLTYFLQNPDRPLTRDMILNSVWGYESFPNTRTVDAHVVRLRQKLEPEPNTPRHILTVHGVGYRFLP